MARREAVAALRNVWRADPDQVSTPVRAAAAVRRQLERAAGAVDMAASRLPYFPDPDAKCVAHGVQFCASCHRNPAYCMGSDSVGCGRYSGTGMHWDTCPNRIDRPEDQR